MRALPREGGEAAAGDAWVMDGNYTTHLDLRLPRAEAVIWLDLPRYVYFPRTVWRMIRNYGRERGDIGPGCPERFDLPFLRDWVWTYPTLSRAQHLSFWPTYRQESTGSF
jgi:adenylate kinase family enzyme